MARVSEGYFCTLDDQVKPVREHGRTLVQARWPAPIFLSGPLGERLLFVNSALTLNSARNRESGPVGPASNLVWKVIISKELADAQGRALSLPSCYGNVLKHCD